MVIAGYVDENAIVKSLNGAISDDAKGALTDIVFVNGQLSFPEYSLPAATEEALGGVKMAEVVADAAGEAPTAEEFKALLDSLKAAGIMASE